MFQTQNPVYEETKAALRATPKTWLVTGVAGFIGSHLLETLLNLNQRVVGLDNFSTGFKRNLDEVRTQTTQEQWQRFSFLDGDIGDLEVCRQACVSVDFVLHQAALGSVPGSLADPVACHRSNVTGFLNMLTAAREAKTKRLVYASSSAVYGDDPELPKVEAKIGGPLSPYAATKSIDEIYASVYSRCFQFDSIGLRYFNVFGPRQDPQGAYAAVIPAWTSALLKRAPVHINGDGETTRDFCYIENVVQANLLAATVTKPDALNQIYNVALGECTTLNQLFQILQEALLREEPSLPRRKPLYREFRAGDVRYSMADIDKARRLLGFLPTHRIDQGLACAMKWYIRSLQ